MGLETSYIVKRTPTLVICLMHVTRAIVCVIMVRTRTTTISLTLARLPLQKYPGLRCQIIFRVVYEDQPVKESPLIDTVPCPIVNNV